MFYLGFVTLVPQIYSKNYSRDVPELYSKLYSRRNFTHKLYSKHYSRQNFTRNFTQNITHGETLLTALLTTTLNKKTPDHGSKPWSNNLGTFPRCLRTPLGFPPARYTTVLLFSCIVSSLEHALQFFSTIGDRSLNDNDVFLFIIMVVWCVTPVL